MPKFEVLIQKVEHIGRFELFTGYKSKKNLYLYKKLGYSIFRRKRISPKPPLVYLQKIKD